MLIGRPSFRMVYLFFYFKYITTIATLAIEHARAIAREDKSIKGLSGNVHFPKQTPYRIASTDGKTKDDVLVYIYKNSELVTVVNFHANNTFQYRQALDIIDSTILYRTESITTLINKLKAVKAIPFYEI